MNEKNKKHAKHLTELIEKKTKEAVFGLVNEIKDLIDHYSDELQPLDKMHFYAYYPNLSYVALVVNALEDQSLEEHVCKACGLPYFLNECRYARGIFEGRKEIEVADDWREYAEKQGIFPVAPCGHVQGKIIPEKLVLKGEKR